MTIILIWYLSGVSSALIGEYYFENKITVGALITSLTLFGILGLATLILVIPLIIKDIKDKDGFKNFWNTKLF